MGEERFFRRSTRRGGIITRGRFYELDWRNRRWNHPRNLVPQTPAGGFNREKGNFGRITRENQNRYYFNNSPQQLNYREIKRRGLASNSNQGDLNSIPIVIASCQTGQKSSLPIVEIEIAGCNQKALLDSGAPISICSSKVLELVKGKIKLLPIDSTVLVKGITGDSLPFKACYRLPIIIGKDRISHTFHVTEEAIHEDYTFVLGWDIIKAHGILLDPNRLKNARDPTPVRVNSVEENRPKTSRSHDADMDKIRYRKTGQPDKSRKFKKPLICQVCEITCSNPGNFHNHMNGRTHREEFEKLLALRRKRKQISESRTKTSRSVDRTFQKKYSRKTGNWCTVCESSFSGNYFVHRRTKLHRKKRRKKYPKCRHCRLHFNSSEEYKDHCKSEKHRSKVAEYFYSKKSARANAEEAGFEPSEAEAMSSEQQRDADNSSSGNVVIVSAISTVEETGIVPVEMETEVEKLNKQLSEARLMAEEASERQRLLTEEIEILRKSCKNLEASNFALEQQLSSAGNEKKDLQVQLEVAQEKVRYAETQNFDLSDRIAELTQLNNSQMTQLQNLSQENERLSSELKSSTVTNEMQSTVDQNADVNEKENEQLQKSLAEKEGTANSSEPEEGGESFVVSVQGCYCRLCREFYKNVTMAQHCDSEAHYSLLAGLRNGYFDVFSDDEGLYVPVLDLTEGIPEKANPSEPMREQNFLRSNKAQVDTPVDALNNDPVRNESKVYFAEICKELLEGTSPEFELVRDECTESLLGPGKAKRKKKKKKKKNM